jgi:hypothetical protein
MSKKWVLDGIGALLGTPAGSSYSTYRETIAKLRPVIAKDGVHLETRGNVNLSKAIVCALESLNNGKLEADPDTDTSFGTGCASGFSGNGSKLREFFWRGFTSPVGDAVGCAVGIRIRAFTWWRRFRPEENLPGEASAVSPLSKRTHLLQAEE